MRSIVAAPAALLTLLLLLLVPTITSSIDEAVEEPNEFGDAFKTHVPEDHPRKERFENALERHARCKDWKWSCTRACRAQVPLNATDTPACIAPIPGETCFGQPIDYKYVPSRDSLPYEYEVLKRFPRCWSALAPTLCAIIYRPCGVYDFDSRQATNTSLVEVWQRYPISMCRRAHELCQDAIKEGFFPSTLVDCSRTAENITWLKQKTNTLGPMARFVPNGNKADLATEWDRQTVFTEDGCAVQYTGNASRHDTMQCIFPLVYTSHEKIRPVIDKCYLPCRNALISSPDKFLSFRISRAFICLAAIAACLFVSGFIVVRSKILDDSHAIYAIVGCLVCFAVYMVVWALGSLGFAAEASECTVTAQGVPIRNSPIELYGSVPCIIGAIIAHTFLLSSIGFLASAYALSAAAASRAAEREAKKEEKKNDKSGIFRAKLTAGIFCVSLVCGVAAYLLKMIATDGVSGVCSVGLHSIVDHFLTVALPGLAFCGVALALGLRDVMKEKKQRQAELDYAIAEKIREAVDYQKAKEKVGFWEDRGPSQKEDICKQVKVMEVRDHASLPTLEERTEEGASSGRGGGDEIESAGESTALVHTLQGDEQEKQWISAARKKEIADEVRVEMEEEWRGKEKKAWYEAISSRYTLLALCLCMGSLLFGLCVHYVFLANDGKAEYEKIRAYVTCVMSKSIVRKDLHWMTESVHAAERSDGETDPLVRRHKLASELRIHDCSYPTEDDRMIGLMSVFIALPLAPLTVFLWAFFAGVMGIGGMSMVMTRRPPKVNDNHGGGVGDLDIEMTQMATNRDEESQMMSVGSSLSHLDDIEEAYPPAAPSSTASTFVSFGSTEGASSLMTDSVSLRGELARFPSTERVLTVRAPSPVPSRARTEVVAAPARRARSAGRHHRKLDVRGGRSSDRRERSRMKIHRNRATSAEIEARREGVAETGQLLPARATATGNPTPPGAERREDHDDDDVGSEVSTHTQMEGANSVASSFAYMTPSERNVMITNAHIYTTRARQETLAGELQRRMQIVQEEMLVRAKAPAPKGRGPIGANCTYPEDSPEGNLLEQPERRTLAQWRNEVSAIRDGLYDFSAHFDSANVGMRVGGLINNLLKLMEKFGTSHFPSNYRVILYAFERLQGLLYHLEHSMEASPAMLGDLNDAISALEEQSETNVHENAAELLRHTHSRYLNLDLDHEDVVKLRCRYQEPGLSEEERRKLFNDALRRQNELFVQRLAQRNREAADAAAARSNGVSNGAGAHPARAVFAQQQQLQGGRGAQPPHLSPMVVVDLTRPPAGASAASEFSYSVDGSSVPSSSLSDMDDERVRQYLEVYSGPPNYDDGHTTGAEVARAAALVDTSHGARNNLPLRSGVVRGANGTAAPPPLVLPAVPTQPLPASRPHATATRRSRVPCGSVASASSTSSARMETADGVSDYMARVRLNNRHLVQRAAHTESFPAPVSSENNLASGFDSDDMSSVTSMDTIERGAASNAAAFRNGGASASSSMPREAYPMARERAIISGSGPRPSVFGPPVRVVSPHASEEENNAGAAQDQNARLIGQLAQVQVPTAAPAASSSNGVARRKEESKKRRLVGMENQQRQGRAAVGGSDDEQAGPSHRLGNLRAAAVSRFDRLTDMDDGLDDGYMRGRVVPDMASELRDVPGNLLMYVVDGDTHRPANDQELDDFSRILSGENVDEEPEDEERRRLRRDEDEAGPSMSREERDEDMRRRRALLRSRYMNHSDPDLAIADEEERERQRLETRREEEEREREEGDRGEHENREPVGDAAPQNRNADDDDSDTDSDCSLLTQEEQVQLVQALRVALQQRDRAGLPDNVQRLIDHLLIALDHEGGISREEIMRFRVQETNRENRARQNPAANSPYSVSSVVVSRLSLAEIGARVDAIRAFSQGTLYPLEIYYQLHLADVVWPLAGRDVILGDNVYTHDEMNRALGTDTPIVPDDADGSDFHQLMRKRAITAASLTGRAYGRARGNRGFTYSPPRLPDMGVYRTFGDPSVLLSAIDGEFQPLLDAINNIPLTMPDVMRLDNHSEHTLGTHLRHFRDYLDERAAAAGFPTRPDTYVNDEVPSEPTGSRTEPPAQQQQQDDQDENGQGDDGGNGAPPPPAPEF